MNFSFFMGFPFSGKDGLIESVYLPYFKNHGERSLRYIVESSVARKAFLSEYKNLPPLESLAEEEKKELKKYIHEMFRGKGVKEKMAACKVVYTLGSLL